MGLFGAKKRRARELAHEVLKDIRIDLPQMKEHSRVNFEADMRRVVDLGKEDDLVARQSGNRRDEGYDDRQRWSMKRSGR